MVDSTVNPLSKLKLDFWFKVLIPVGVIVLLFAIFTSNNLWFLFGAGLLLIGLGEWKNMKYHFVEAHATFYEPYRSASIPIRKPDALGVLLDILGVIALIIWGLEFFNIISIFKN